jgi:hypothetical protein
MEKIYQYIENNQKRFVSELFTFLKQPSISSQRSGSADNKGQLFAHIKAVETILKSGETLPMNLKKHLR